MKKIVISSALALGLAGGIAAPATAASGPVERPQGQPSQGVPTPVPSGETAPSSGTSSANNYEQTEAVAEEMLRLMNEERAKEGSQPLTQVDALDKIAGDWSGVMAQENNLYHNPNFGEQTFATGANSAAENVAYGSLTPEDPKEFAKSLFDQWMNSPGHRANIMNGSSNAIGFGVAIDSQGGYYATQNFASYSKLPNS